MTDRVSDFLAKAEARSFEDLVDALNRIETSINQAGNRKFHVEVPWHVVILMAILPSAILVSILLFLLR